MNGQKEDADSALSIRGFEGAYEPLMALAAQGNAYAQLYLGYMYEEGRGVKQSNNEALACYIVADTQGGLADAQYRLGLICELGELGCSQDFEIAAKWYRHAADQGFALAQFRLAGLYHFGRGVLQDYEEAAKLYRLAAEQGLDSAQFNFGCVNEDGHGVPQNLEEAVKWYLLAAKQGWAPAQRMLGVKFRFGAGVPRDYVQAHMWANLAGANSNSTSELRKSAMELRDAVTSEMTADQIAEAQNLARTFTGYQQQSATTNT